MKVIVVKDYDAVSKEAFNVMKEVVTSKKDAVLGLATGSSPIGLYKNMIQDHKDNGTSYAQCQSFNLDEYVGIDRNHPESYWTFMHENLFKGIDLPEDKIHVPYGSTKEDLSLIHISSASAIICVCFQTLSYTMTALSTALKVAKSSYA